MILTVTTCGTSIFTNGASDSDRGFLSTSANNLENEYSKDEIARLNNIAEEKRNFLSQERDENKIRGISAELNGLIGYHRKNNNLKSEKNIHFLIHSDTYQGELAAQIIQDWGNNNGYDMSICKIPDLNTHDLESFRMGINNLVYWCENTIPEYRTRKYKVVFNLVGGFKILQGYMQTLGMFYADESVYIFEGSDEILSIPRLPIDFLESFKTMLKKNIGLVRALQWSNLKLSDCSEIHETMLDIVEGKCTLSTWGQLMLYRTQEDIYSEKLLPSPSRLIKYSDKTVLTSRKLENHKKARLNKKIDDLVRYLEGGHRDPQNSLDFKALKNNPKPPSTHEFDLWPDEDVWRGFGYFDGEVFVINEIGEKLSKQ